MITYLTKWMDDKVFNEKNQEKKAKWYSKKNLLLMLVLGLLLLVISMPTGDKDDTTIHTYHEEESTEPTSGDEYKLRMELELEDLLQSVDGVGQVQVMITLSASTKKVVEKDMINKDLDMQEETIYQDNSEGQSPYVNQEIYPEIGGVIVSAEGGENPVVVKNITEAIQALFQVDTHKIKVMKMKFNS